MQEDHIDQFLWANLSQEQRKCLTAFQAGRYLIGDKEVVIEDEIGVNTAHQWVCGKIRGLNTSLRKDVDTRFIQPMFSMNLLRVSPVAKNIAAKRI